MSKAHFLPRDMWHNKIGCPVTIEQRGHFEIGTVMARLPNDRRVEVYLEDLQDLTAAISRAEMAEVGE